MLLVKLWMSLVLVESIDMIDDECSLINLGFDVRNATLTAI